MLIDYFCNCYKAIGQLFMDICDSLVLHDYYSYQRTENTNERVVLIYVVLLRLILVLIGILDFEHRTNVRNSLKIIICESLRFK